MASRSLGTLTLDLIARIGGFEAGMDKAARTTDKRMRQIQKQARDLGRDIGLSLAAIGSTAAAAFGLYLKNTAEAEKVQAQLTSRIKDTGGAAGQTLKSLNAMADALQRATTFDDEAIGGVQSVLLAFKDIKGDNFQKATEAVLDLSTAMGTDLNSSALQVGKALQDPVKGLTALSRAGVQFTDDQKAVIKALVESGDKAGAQGIILKELAGKMGTAAEAARNTLGGALQALKNSFDNLLEGDTSEGGLKGTRDTIESLNKTLNDPSLKHGIAALASGLLTAANAAIQAAGKLGGFIQQYREFLSQKGFLPADDGSTLKELQARRKKLTDALNKQGPSNLISGASDPLSKLFGLDTKVTGGLKKQIAEVDSLIDARKKQEADFAKFRGLPENFGLNVNPNGTPAPAGATPSTRTTGRSSGGKSDAVRQAEEAARAAQEAAEAQGRWHDSVLDMTATLAGPAAEAQREYERNISQLNADFNEGKVTLADYAKATEIYAEQRDKAVDAIKAQKTQAEQLINDMQAELALVGLSNKEREKEIALRYAGADATDAQRAAVADLSDALYEANEQAAYVDDLKNALSDTFVDFVSGAKSAKEAFGDFADYLFKRSLQMVTDNVLDGLFGKSSGSGGGSGSGLFSGLLDLFTGGGFGGEGSPLAAGGPTIPGMYHQVGELNRPEMYYEGGKQYLIPGDKGRVVPMGGGGISQTINFVTNERRDNRSRMQFAQATGAAAQEALRRNRG